MPPTFRNPPPLTALTRPTYNSLTRPAGKRPQEKGSAPVNPVYPIRLAGRCLVAVMAAAILLAASIACAAPPPGSLAGDVTANGQLRGELTVFAAASLTQAFAEIAAAFEQAHPGTAVTVNFDGSQRLRTQLEHGASADLFAPADREQMDALIQAGLIGGQPDDFAANQMVFLVHRDFAPANLSALAAPGVKIVLALPEAPAGRYSRTVIERMRLNPRFGPAYADGLLANVVSAEANVRSVAQKVALGEADAGIAYRTDALPAYTAQRVNVLSIPESVNVTARYPIAILRDSTQPQLAQTFINFVLSSEGQAILERNGFDSPANRPTDSP